MNRNATSVLLLVLGFLLSFSSCQPSEEDYLTKISKAWQLNKHYVNNEDKTAEFKSVNKNFTLQFYEDYTFLQSAVVNDTFRTKSGSWDLNEDLDTIFFQTSTDTNAYFIRLLRQKNFNIRQTVADTSYDYFLTDY